MVPYSFSVVGSNGLLKFTVKPVALPTTEVTCKPVAWMALLVPVLRCRSLTVTVCEPGVSRVTPLVKVCTPLSLPVPS